MQARKSIEKAKALLMKAKALDETGVDRMPQKLASDKRCKMVEMAEAILLTDNLSTVAIPGANQKPPRIQ